LTQINRSGEKQNQNKTKTNQKMNQDLSPEAEIAKRTQFLGFLRLLL
jgi:hypothetical protein